MARIRELVFWTCLITAYVVFVVVAILVWLWCTGAQICLWLEENRGRQSKG